MGIAGKEEVLLHDGSKLIVERTVERGGRHEIGQPPPIKVESLSLPCQQHMSASPGKTITAKTLALPTLCRCCSILSKERLTWFLPSRAVCRTTSTQSTE